MPQLESPVMEENLEETLPSGDRLTVRVGISLDEMSKLLIEATLRQHGGNVRTAASILGIDRTTLYSKIKRYGIVAGRALKPSRRPR